jgi:hypothetical protein
MFGNRCADAQHMPLARSASSTAAAQGGPEQRRSGIHGALVLAVGDCGALMARP